VVTNVAWFLISAVALFRIRAASQRPAAAADADADAPQMQFPGVPDTTGQLAVVEALRSER
jgi:hypothetical protein